MDHMRSLLSRMRRTVESEPANVRTVLALPTTINPEVCPLCRGAGYTRADVQPGHPQFGKPVPCACKLAQMKVQQQQNLMEVSGITVLERYKKATFDSFTFTLPSVKNAYRSAMQFAACPIGWLVMTGPYGCGKTHLAVAIAKQRLEAGDTVLVQTVPDLLDHLRGAFNPAVAQTYDDRFEEMKEADMLVLDDYGAQQNTAWANEKLFQLVNHRYNASLPTVITSNDTYLENIDPRVRSRLCDRELVNWIIMEGARDYRMHGDQSEED